MLWHTKSKRPPVTSPPLTPARPPHLCAGKFVGCQDPGSKLRYILRDARFFLIKSNNHENVSLAKAKVSSASGDFHQRGPALRPGKAAFNLAALLLPAGRVVDAARQREEAELGFPRGSERRPRLLRQGKWQISRCVCV